MMTKSKSSGVGHIVALYPAGESYEDTLCIGGYLGCSGWELLNMDTPTSNKDTAADDHVPMGIRRWSVATGKCHGYLLADRDLTTCTTSTDDEEALSAYAVWELRRYGGGTISLACMVGGKRYYLQLEEDCSTTCPFTLSQDVTVRSYLRIHTLCPPTVNIAPLCSLYLLDGAESDSDFTDFEEKVCTQALLDAAQQTGYFFISGVEGIELMAAEVVDHVRNGYAVSPLKEEFHKCTLFTSTGKVKASSVPERYEQVVVPSWVGGAEGGMLEAYFTRIMQIAHMILETLLQREFRGDGRGSNIEGPAKEADLYGMMRAVCYPSGVASTSNFGPQHKSLEEHTDKTWITVLAATSLEGLEFVNGDGTKSTVRSIEDFGADTNKLKSPPRLLVNIGDAMQTYTGGAFLSRQHRARNVTSTGPRVSLPLFVEPAPGQWPMTAAEGGAVRHVSVKTL